jgi:creatinine amidohydrolase
MKTIHEVMWAERTREEIPQWAARNTVVILPIASTEQHGRHLPLDTDCRTVEYVARQAACLAEDVPVLVAPLIPFGISPHHMGYGGGTITLGVETTVRVLHEVCACIVAHGFERILILSGHGGNGNTIGAAALEIRHRLQRQVQACCWFDLIPAAMDAVREGVGSSIGHSGELESSTILTLAPELVRRERMELLPGVSDDPTLASVAKGERVLQAAVEAVAQYVRQLAATPGREVIGIPMITKKD